MSRDECGAPPLSYTALTEGRFSADFRAGEKDKKIYWGM